MKSVYSLALTLTILFTSSMALAEFGEGKKAVTAGLGFVQAGPAISVDYEYGYDRTYGIGGQFRFYSSDKDDPQPGGTLFGAFIRPHFNRQAWDFYVSPGFAFMNYEPGGKKDNETMMGPTLNIGLLYETSATTSVGIEQTNFYGWFGEEDYRSHILDEVTVTLRLIF